MLVTTAVAVTFGVVLNFGWTGVLLAAFAWFTALCIWLPVPMAAAWSIWSFGLLLLGLVLILPSFNSVRTPARRSFCAANLKQLTLSIHAYYERHGRYPPPYTVDADGNKLHSWRTLLLPDIEQGHIFEKIKFDEPWDSPHNSQFHDQIIPLFMCPTRLNYPSTMTSYVAVVGPDTAWPEDGVGLRRLEAPSQTILLVECADSGIHWMEPRDLHVSQMNPNVNPTRGQGISRHHPGAAIVGFADTNTRTVTSTTDPKIIAKLLSRHTKDKQGVAAFFFN
ncbi:MAG: DUF1559 domain-containing protein [Planctomycetota bacterium]|nr:DUF1559 domain-containing protein [Planctomycetota bacterium]